MASTTNLSFFSCKKEGGKVATISDGWGKKQVIFCKMSTRQTNSVIIFLPRLLYVCFLLGKQRDIPLSLSVFFFSCVRLSFYFQILFR